MKRGVGRSHLFTLSGQWLAVIWSVAFFLLLFSKSTSRQGAGRGCGGCSGPQGKWGPGDGGGAWCERGGQQWQHPPHSQCTLLSFNVQVSSLLTCTYKNGLDSEINSQQSFHEVWPPESHEWQKWEKLRAKDSTWQNGKIYCHAVETGVSGEEQWQTRNLIVDFHLSSFWTAIRCNVWTQTWSSLKFRGSWFKSTFDV